MYFKKVLYLIVTAMSISGSLLMASDDSIIARGGGFGGGRGFGGGGGFGYHGGIDRRYDADRYMYNRGYNAGDYGGGGVYYYDDDDSGVYMPNEDGYYYYNDGSYQNY